MPPLKYTLHIAGEQFLVVKIDEPQDGDFFYILPHNPAMCSFFMVQSTIGRWQMFNKQHLTPEVLLLENIFSSYIEKIIIENQPSG